MTAGLGMTAVVLCGGSLAWSQSAPAPAAPSAAPTTQPQQQPPQQLRTFGERRYEGRGGVDGMRPPMEWRRRGGDGMRADYPEPTQEEWNEAEAFMKSHSPERLARLEEIGDDERQQNVRHMFWQRYRALQELKEQDPELYQIRLARMPVEDKVFELSWRLRHKQRDSKPEETKSQLRAQFRLLIKSRLDERALHVQRMERRLKQDEQRLDELVESNMADIQQENLPRDLRPPAFMPRRERRIDEDATNTAPSAQP
jgi:hypothetical protein